MSRSFFILHKGRVIHEGNYLQFWIFYMNMKSNIYTELFGKNATYFTLFIIFIIFVALFT
jgi:hypothetical protein